MFGHIYILLFPSGKWYIGSTTKKYISSRIGVHKADLMKGKTSHLYNHIRKIGWNCMTYEVLETIEIENKSDILILEQSYLERYKDDNCLNQVKAFTGLSHTEYYKIYRKTNSEMYVAYGKQYREEHREKHREYMKEYHKQKSKVVECLPNPV